MVLRVRVSYLAGLTALVVATLGGPEVSGADPLARPVRRAGAAVTHRAVKVKVDPYWETAREEVYKTTEKVLAQHKGELERGIRYNKFVRGNPRRRWIALTFDDGPHPDYTLRLLKILKQANVKATFFVVGEMARDYPQGIKAEVAAGHVIGNHTYHHVDLTKIPAGMVATEIRACEDVVRSITGKRTTFFRPPGGDYDKHVIETAEALKYTTVLWTDDPADYDEPPGSVIRRRALGNISNGGVLLLHDGAEHTLQILPGLLDTLKRRGYRFVTIDEMMKDPVRGRATDRGLGATP